MRYVCKGEHDGSCDHAHVTMQSAIKCLLRTPESDREIHVLEAGKVRPLTNDEAEELYEHCN